LNCPEEFHPELESCKDDLCQCASRKYVNFPVIDENYKTKFDKSSAGEDAKEKMPPATLDKEITNKETTPILISLNEMDPKNESFKEEKSSTITTQITNLNNAPAPKTSFKETNRKPLETVSDDAEEQFINNETSTLAISIETTEVTSPMTISSTQSNNNNNGSTEFELLLVTNNTFNITLPNSVTTEATLTTTTLITSQPPNSSSFISIDELKSLIFFILLICGVLLLANVSCCVVFVVKKTSYLKLAQNSGNVEKNESTACVLEMEQVEVQNDLYVTVDAQQEFLEPQEEAAGITTTKHQSDLEETEIQEVTVENILYGICDAQPQISSLFGHQKNIPDFTNNVEIPSFTADDDDDHYESVEEIQRQLSNTIVLDII